MAKKAEGLGPEEPTGSLTSGKIRYNRRTDYPRGYTRTLLAGRLGKHDALPESSSTMAFKERLGIGLQEMKRVRAANGEVKFNNIDRNAKISNALSRELSYALGRHNILPEDDSLRFNLQSDLRRWYGALRDLAARTRVLPPRVKAVLSTIDPPVDLTEDLPMKSLRPGDWEWDEWFFQDKRWLHHAWDRVCRELYKRNLAAIKDAVTAAKQYWREEGNEWFLYVPNGENDGNTPRHPFEVDREADLVNGTFVDALGDLPTPDGMDGQDEDSSDTDPESNT